MSQTLRQCASLVPTARQPKALKGKETEDCGVKNRRGRSTFSSSSTSTPLSGCHILFVSRGRLCGNGDVARGSLAWLASREDIGSTVPCAVLTLEKEKEGESESIRRWRVRREEWWGGCTHSAMSLTWKSFRQA